MMLLIVMEWLRLRCVGCCGFAIYRRWYIIMSWRRGGQELALIVLISNSILFFLSAYTRCSVQVFPLDYITWDWLNTLPTANFNLFLHFPSMLYSVLLQCFRIITRLHSAIFQTHSIIRLSSCCSGVDCI